MDELLPDLMRSHHRLSRSVVICGRGLPLYKQPVLVDKSLTSDPEILFNAGSHHEAIRMRYQDFEELVKPKVAEFGVRSL